MLKNIILFILILESSFLLVMGNANFHLCDLIESTNIPDLVHNGRLQGWECDIDRKLVKKNNPCNWNGIACNDDGHITHIVLNNYNINGHIPDSLSTMETLKLLDLRGNKLSGIPPLWLQRFYSNDEDDSTSSTNNIDLSNVNKKWTRLIPSQSFSQSMIKQKKNIQSSAIENDSTSLSDSVSPKANANEDEDNENKTESDKKIVYDSGASFGTEDDKSFAFNLPMQKEYKGEPYDAGASFGTEEASSKTELVLPLVPEVFTFKDVEKCCGTENTRVNELVLLTTFAPSVAEKTTLNSPAWASFVDGVTVNTFVFEPVP